MSKRHRLTALLLSLVMVVTLVVPTLAKETIPPETIIAHNAQVMKDRWLNYLNDCFSWKVCATVGRTAI